MIVDIDDDAQLQGLTVFLRRCDVPFQAIRPPAQALLYEPDGVLYAVALADGMTIDYAHREKRLQRGDMIVVPQGLAIDVSPRVNLLALRCEGAAPDQFRERFIQVWGYEHFSSEIESLDPGEPTRREVIPATDLRFHLVYDIQRLHEGMTAEDGLVDSGEDILLLLNLEAANSFRVHEKDSGMIAELPPNHLFGKEPGVRIQIEGRGMLGCLRLRSEARFHALRALRRIREVSPNDPDSTADSA